MVISLIQPQHITKAYRVNYLACKLEHVHIKSNWSFDTLILTSSYLLNNGLHV